MGSSKKRMNDNAPSFKRKKMKTNIDTDSADPVPNMEDTNSESLTAELLSAQTIREGMLLLGCITDVKTTAAVVSLPGYLTGILPANNISNTFTKSLSNFTDSSDFEDTEPTIEAIIKTGMVFPCKVIEISKDVSRGKPSFTLSINPQDINSELKPSSLYLKMVLYVSVCSIEDHGYVVDVGTKCIQGFLPKKHSEDERTLKIGAVIPTCVKKIFFSDKSSAKIQLSEINFNEDYPEVCCEDMKLSSLLPGAKIQADIIEVKHPFVYMKFLYFDACASLLFLNRTPKSIKIGSSVVGTVLYVHPITHMIYIMLSSKPSPDIFAGYFGLRRFESVQNLKFQCVFKNRAYYKINRGTYGFINVRDLPNKEGDDSSVSKNLSKACVVNFHYMDNLVQMTAKKSMVEKKIVLPEDVQIGDMYEAAVKNHVADGMLLRICPGLFGFVHRMHLSDVSVTKPEALHPVGSKVKCRVLTIDEKGKMNLTCKESLVNLPDSYVLSSYDIAQRGQFYKGVVIKKTDTYMLVLFFNNVKGIVSTDHIPKGSVFYEGQIVMCKVLDSNPLKKKLKLSLETSGCYPIEEVGEDKFDDVNSSNKEVPKTGKKIKTLKSKDMKIDSEKTKLGKKVKLLSEEPCKTVLDSPKAVKAVIKSKKGSQLNILLGESKGRVHITEVGCVSEGVYPLKEFTRGQEIKVHVIGEYKKRRYLKITSPNVFLKECSLTFPSVSPKCLEPGTSVIGFVKEVCDVSAVIWLTPTETGVLHYLHFSQNPREVKKVRRHLKVGLSLKVSIVEQEKGKSHQCFSLTKIEKKLPQVGENVLGLVQIGCLDRGLILQLPFGYHGVAAITDLSDVYAPVQSLFEKCRRLKFVLCYILEVNHQTKYCQVSLRKSRIYNKKITADSSFCSEVLPSNVKEGDTVKGFVKTVSNTALTVTFGRNLAGKVLIHSCSVPGCSACNASKNIHTKYPVGSVIEVVVEKIGVGNKSFSLVIGDSRNLVNSRCNRLSIKEDISWDEVE